MEFAGCSAGSLFHRLHDPSFVRVRVECREHDHHDDDQEDEHTSRNEERVLQIFFGHEDLHANLESEFDIFLGSASVQRRICPGYFFADERQAHGCKLGIFPARYGTRELIGPNQVLFKYSIGRQRSILFYLPR